MPMVETTYNIPGAPRLALLADLHGRPYDHIISSVATHRPSLVCVVGDIVYGSHPEDDRSPLDTQENVLPFLTACATIAPTFLSLGNHEWMLDAADLERIRSTGVVILDNDFKAINIDGRKIVLAGLTSGYVTDYRRFVATQDGKVRYPKKDTISGIGGAVTASQHIPDTDWLEDFTAASPGDAHILLSHHPEYWPEVKEKKINLMLSGHAHGGQWAYYSFRRKRMCGVWCPGQGFLPRWTRGVYEGRLVVSAGLSNTARIPRICNPTEVVFIESP